MTLFPDKPVLSSAGVLGDLKEGDWLATPKMDGWRVMIEVAADRCVFTTRHQKPCPVNPVVAAETYGRLRHLPVGTIIDAEWMARRAGDAERFWFFDLIRHGQEWLRTVPASGRFGLLSGLAPHDLIVPCCTSGYADAFEQSKQHPDREGVVLKHRDGRYIGSARQCAINPMMLKCKFRDGADGQKVTA
jgi:ATP-dependent DNA ligase